MAGRLPKAQAGEVVLLSGGNPQIPLGYGDAVVQTYIAAMPGWKQDVGREIDAIISRTLPNVLKAVKWNTPMYGTEPHHYFLGFHCFTNYVKVSFLRGAELEPQPPGPSRQKAVRYLDIRENAAVDVAQFTDWVLQASRLPGEKL
jgi:hypothetical protein